LSTEFTDVYILTLHIHNLSARLRVVLVVGCCHHCSSSRRRRSGRSSSRSTGSNHEYDTQIVSASLF